MADPNVELLAQVAAALGELRAFVAGVFSRLLAEEGFRNALPGLILDDSPAVRLPVVADSAYGNSFEFREQLRQRQLDYVVAVEPKTVVWTADPNAAAVPRSAPTGRPRRYPPSNLLPEAQDLAAVARQVPASAWKKVTWRAGTRGPQRSRFAQVEIWAAHGWRAQEHPQRAAEWLLIEWPEGESGPSKYWLAQLGAGRTGLRRWVKTAHARWRIEMDCRELKEELGLDHFEGRHWLGWHHHVTLVTMAYAFLQSERARLKKNFWCDIADDEEATPAHSH